MQESRFPIGPERFTLMHELNFLSDEETVPEVVVKDSLQMDEHELLPDFESSLCYIMGRPIRTQRNPECLSEDHQTIAYKLR